MKPIVPTVAAAAAIGIAGIMLLVVSYFSATFVTWLASLSPQGVTWFRSGCLLFTVACLAVLAVRKKKKGPRDDA